jgi:asparagine synthase (glutamine-hydrolysing)
MLGKSAANANRWLNMERLGAVARDPFFVAGARTDTVRGLSNAQLVQTNLPMLLHWEDRDSMAHGVESRVPFLDYRLVEFALGLPEEYKLRRGMTKRVLREAMRGTLPELVRGRIDKLGFATPEEVWVRQQAPDLFRAAMASAVDSSRGLIRPVALTDLEDVIAGRRSFSFLPWRLISFGAWMERFGVAK